MAESGKGWKVDRRKLLIGGGAGAGLLLAWGVWPRSYDAGLNASPGETIFNAFLKIGEDGRVVVIVPQAEMGQGVTTSLPQILADELGADWRTIAVEPAPISPLYANYFIVAEGAKELPDWLQGVGGWAMREVAIRSALMVTGGSTSIRGFEQRYREAGAAARALLCKAAGKRWGADWDACETEKGFVTRGADRIRFGEIAAEAALLKPPSNIPLRVPGEGKISGQSVPRIDLPAKVDGTARYAGDVRLPGMVFASVRHGPFGDTRLAGIDKAKAHAIGGVVGVVENPHWVAAIATNWWAANRALDAMTPKFHVEGALPDDASILASLEASLSDASKGKRFVERGDPDGVLADGEVVSAEYSVPLAVHSPMEPLVAAAHLTGDELEIWMPTQAPGMARAAISRATGLDESAITLYPMLVGGGFGRKTATDAAVVAAIIAIKMKRPVQVMWSRSEEIMQDDYRPPAIGRLKARLGPGGRPIGWSIIVASPSAMAEQFAKLQPSMGTNPEKPESGATSGAEPPYSIPAVAVEHRVARIGVPTGMWRSVAHSSNAFFVESFVDELAAKASVEPLSFRMQMLGSSPRLARCLTTAASIGNWQGGVEGSGQGIAAHSCFGSHIAMLAEARIGDGGKIVVDRIIAVADVGRIIHPDIVRQQIEGGIIWGLSAALGEAISVKGGLVTARNFDGLGLVTLAETPEIVVELITNHEDPGGVGELGVPTVAPAVANAIFSTTGQRLRSLPLRPGRE